VQPGETKQIAFKLTAEHFSMLDDDLQPVVEPGEFKVMIGSSCKNIQLASSFAVK
jgi:beta-glucosidase